MPVVVKKKKKALGSRFSQRVEESPYRPRWAPKRAPCMMACPCETGIREYLTTIGQYDASGCTAEESLEKAWHILTNTNPLPSVCGQVCPHPCIGECNRSEKDESVNIPAIERVIGDYGVKHKLSHKKIGEESYAEKIAVVGSGPSGLSCAFQLARRGYPVTIFEALDKAGGMLRYGIPDYRLRKDIMDAEIEAILNLGIDIKYNTRIGDGIPLDELNNDYRAVYVAIGAHEGIALGLDGEDLPNVFSGVGFLNKVNSGEKVIVGKKVIVIGGGDTALDAARVSLRLGADVSIFYRRTRKEMPAIEHEIVAGEEEGIHFEFLTAPAEILKDKEKAIGLKCIRMKLGEPDASGRPRPVPLEGSEFDTVDVDTIISAVSQKPDFRGLEQVRNEEGWISVDERKQTSQKDIFAGGDVTNKLGYVTEAISWGRKAAESIDAYLRGKEVEKATDLPVIHASGMKLSFYEAKPQNIAPILAVNERKGSFNETNLPLSEAQLIDEAKRCMSCGMCFNCDACFTYCQENAVKRTPEGSELKYAFDLNHCNGCKKCAEECPCGFIDMV